LGQEPTSDIPHWKLGQSYPRKTRRVINDYDAAVEGRV
jgi:hypothetical protein